jgi:WYL domain
LDVDADARPWGQTKRFEFIEWRLLWMGRLNRKDLERVFGISTPQASLDINKYQKEFKGNIEYNSTIKSYVRSNNFSPNFLKLSPERYLIQLAAIKTGAIDIADTWFSGVPDNDVILEAERGLSIEIVRALSEAIMSGSSLSISYRSMSRDSHRVIGPHALAYDGHRWHARAWCFEKSEFLDFSIGRIKGAEKAERRDFNKHDDVMWNNYQTLILSPNPELDLRQRSVIEDEFGMINGRVEIKCRKSMCFYFMRMHNLDIFGLPPTRKQVVLLNINDLDPNINWKRFDVVNTRET